MHTRTRKQFQFKSFYLFDWHFTSNCVRLYERIEVNLVGYSYIEYIDYRQSHSLQVLNRSMDPRNPEPQETPLPAILTQLTPQNQLPYIPQSLITSGTRRDCIRLRNIPGGAQVTDILTFLGEFSQFIIFQGVHMVYTAQVCKDTRYWWSCIFGFTIIIPELLHFGFCFQGEPSGEAFIQMDSEESAQLTAINRNKRPIVFAQKKRIIDVIQCSGEDMNLVLTNGIPTTSIPSPPQIPFIQRPILSQGLNLFLNYSSSLLKKILKASFTTHAVCPLTVYLFTFSAAPTLIPTSLPSLQPATLPLAHLPQHLQAAAFQPTMMSAPLAAAPRPAYFPQIVYWYPSPPISPQTYVTHTGPPTLVVMRGLPVNAQVHDILNFFQGFPEVCLGPLLKMKQ